MFELMGFKIGEKLYESREIYVCRALEEESKTSVILKILKEEHSSVESIKKFEHEFKIAKIFNSNRIVKYFSLEEMGHRRALVIEDFNGISLEEYFTSAESDLEEMLKISLSIADAIEHIHNQNIIHKDIKPRNILINPQTEDVKITDFSIAAEVQRESLLAVNPENIEGTLAYISPEQTGRMNRSIDYRTDFYSFGIILYEMFTGVQPFKYTNPSELVHAHIAREANLPHEIKSDIPPVISSIIMKLLSKNAEDRYQSSFGLKYDLEYCYNQLKAPEKMENFKIGEKDISEKFQIPEKLYGREKEIDHLMNLFNSAARGTKEIIFFSGVSGIGKSVLINEIQKLIIETQAYFITGKYDQFKRDIPYTAIIQAFQGFAMQLFTESNVKLNKWKNDILENIGNNGQIIIDVIPEFEMIIGKQEEVQPLPPAEAQNRFNLVFQDFIKTFISEEHPLVIFLDDFQWADSASLQLIDLLLSDLELNHLLFIGAYRTSEVDNSHPFIKMLNNIKKEAFSLENIELTPLSAEDVSDMLADILYCDSDKISDLTLLVHLKTGGNPFFVKEFLKTLHMNELVEFKNEWTWNVSKIEQAKITNNVVNLMTEKIKKLSDDNLNIMMLASCIGVMFDLETLSLLHSKTDDEIFEDLKGSINEGMIIKIEDEFKFVHDKVREAAYSLIEKEEVKKLHYRIGMIKLRDAEKKGDIENNVFNIVNQLNYAKELLNEQEKEELVSLNLKAGLKAKASAAYESAADFFKHAIEILPENSWDTNYELSLSLYTELSEAEFSAAHFSGAENLFDIILTNAKSLYDKIRVHMLKIDYYTGRTLYAEAIETGRDILKQLGVSLPKKPNKLSALPGILHAKRRLRNKDITSLIDKPEMTNPDKIAAMKILMSLNAPAYLSNQDLAPVIIMKLVNLSLKYGNSPLSSIGYVGYGVILSGILGDMSGGYEFCKLALKLNDRFNFKMIQGKIIWISGLIVHWVKPIKNTVDDYFNARAGCTEAGDLQYLGYLITTGDFSSFLTGINLHKMKEIYAQDRPLIEKLNQPQNSFNFYVWYQTIVNLLGESNNTIMINGEYYNEDENLQKFYKAGDNTALASYFVPKIFLYYLFGEYKEGLEICKNEEMIESGLLSQPPIPVFYFIYSLLLLSVYIEVDGRVKKKYKKKIKAIQKKFKKWGEYSKTNYLHKYHLISAELARIAGENEIAAKLYDEAIRGAQKNGFIQEEAIANECAAKFYISREMDRFSSIYMTEAYYCYETWGAKVKAEKLIAEYSAIIQLKEDDK